MRLHLPSQSKTVKSSVEVERIAARLQLCSKTSCSTYNAKCTHLVMNAAWNVTLYSGSFPLSTCKKEPGYKAVWNEYSVLCNECCMRFGNESGEAWE